jgi:hypothetical protein
MRLWETTQKKCKVQNSVSCRCKKQFRGRTGVSNGIIGLHSTFTEANSSALSAVGLLVRVALSPDTATCVHPSEAPLLVLVVVRISNCGSPGLYNNCLYIFLEVGDSLGEWSETLGSCEDIKLQSEDVLLFSWVDEDTYRNPKSHSNPNERQDCLTEIQLKRPYWLAYDRE